jgi:hypothetical protein
MADQEDLLKGLLSSLGSFIGQKTLSEIFGLPSEVTLPDIRAAIAEEINKAFFQQGADDELLNAAAILKDAQDFIAIDYQNAKIAGVSKSELWTKLDDSTATPRLTTLNTEANRLESWIDNAAGQDGGEKVAAKAATIYLGICLHICLYHHERSLVAPDDQVASELADMRDKARIAIATMKPHVLSLVTSRIGCLTYDQHVQGVIFLGPEIKVDRLTDTWFDGQDNNILFGWAQLNDDDSYALALRAVMHNAARVQWGGAQADADAFEVAIENRFMAPLPISNRDTREGFRALVATANLEFGKWAASSRNLLMQLDVVATGIAGTEQERWNYCSLCGMLYFNGAPSRCPKSGPFGTMHMNNSSNNYALHCDSPSPPSGTQADWRWCKNCGVLHFTGGGASVCTSTGGAHASDGSGNYLLVVSPQPSTLYPGIDTVQDNWRCCKNCGALHFGSGASVCPAASEWPGAGPPHDSTGSANYQLSFVGTALWEPPL